MLKKNRIFTVMTIYFDVFLQLSKKKTTTAAADTSSEMSKKLKEAFRNKVSKWRGGMILYSDMFIYANIFLKV